MSGLCQRLQLPEVGHEVEDASEDGLNDGELGVEAQGEEHGKEEDGPQCGQWQAGHQVWVRLESQACPGLCNIFHLHPKLCRHESKDGEDGEAGGEGGHAVADADYHGVPQDVVVELVVRGESDEAPAGDGEREEDLGGSVVPNAHVTQLGPVGHQVEVDAQGCPWKSDRPDEEDEEDDVGEGGGEVDHLST